jgi:hypothetical protein
MIKETIARVLRALPRILQYWLPEKHRGNNSPLNAYERKVYSQNGEDGILEELFHRIGTTNRFFVEFGVQDGSECNTRYLKDRNGWRGIWLDGDGDGNDVQKAFITAENINGLFEQYRVPYEFDLLSIDIDGNDLWVWKALNDVYNPRVVVIEYNSTVPRWKSASIAYDPSHVWDGTNYFGASLKALNKIATEKGYQLVCCDKRSVNAFFVRADVVNETPTLQAQSVAKAFYPVGYGRRKWKMFLGHQPTNRKMMTV